jgi:hypothetical protein
MEIEIVCNADDSTKFTDTLHFVIKEGMDVDVALTYNNIINILINFF